MSEKRFFKTEIKLTPQKIKDGDTSFEAILVSYKSTMEGGFYPSSVVHIDTFWLGNFPSAEDRIEKNWLYNRLSIGEEVVLDAIMSNDERSLSGEKNNE